MYKLCVHDNQEDCVPLLRYNVYRISRILFVTLYFYIKMTDCMPDFFYIFTRDNPSNTL